MRIVERVLDDCQLHATWLLVIAWYLPLAASVGDDVSDIGSLTSAASMVLLSCFLVRYKS